MRRDHDLTHTSKLGVVCDEQEQAIVEEFFQLFKTPWEFCVPDRSYDVVVCTRPDIPRTATKLLVVYGCRQTVIDPRGSTRLDSLPGGRFLEQNRTVLPIYGGLLTFNDIADPVLRLGESNAVAFHTAAQGPSIVRVGYDLFREVEFLLCEG